VRPVDEHLLIDYYRRRQVAVERFRRLLAAMEPMADKPKLTPAQKEALLKEMAALERIAEICAILREDGMPAVSGPPLPAAEAVESIVNDLAILPLDDAIVEHLKAVKHPQNAHQIWAALERAGRKSQAANPTSSVIGALHKLLRRSNDLAKIGFGTWTLKSNHTKAELDAIVQKRGGTGGRNKIEHSRRTREGLKRLAAQGVKLGGKLKMTPELKDRALTLLAMPGAKTRHVAKQLGVSTASLNNNGITKASALAAKGNVTESAATDDPKVVRLVAGGSGNIREKVE
jgi:hypothetical protein